MSARGRGGGMRRQGIALVMGFSLALAVSLPFEAGGAPPAGAVPRAGVDVRVNDTSQERGTCNIQSEAALARSGERVVAGWNDSNVCLSAVERYAAGKLGQPGPDFSASGYGWSDDGGATWHDGGAIPPRPGWFLFGDPVLAAGPDGTFYFASNASDPAGRSTITLSRSTDGGRTFSLPVDVAPDLPIGSLRDKPWVVVDTTRSPHRGTVYVAFTDWSGPEDCGQAIWLSRSTDAGVAFAPPVMLACTHDDAFGVQLAVGPDGEVNAAWLGEKGFSILFARSTDGGRTFSPSGPIASWDTLPGDDQPACVGWDGLARLASDLVFEGRPPPIPLFNPSVRVLVGDIRVEPIPSLAVDVSGSSDPEAPDYNPYRGRIYIALTARSEDNFGLRDRADIAFIRSDDGGETWGPLKGTYGLLDGYFDDDETETDQFQPQVAVGPDATVAVSWYDRRGSGSLPNGQERNLEIEVVAAFSTDGGESFTTEDPLVVSDKLFPPARTSPNTGMFSGCYMGDYNALIAGEPGEFLLAWGDNRDGPAAAPDPNIYFDRIVLYEERHEDGSPPDLGGQSPTADPGEAPAPPAPQIDPPTMVEPADAFQRRRAFRVSWTRPMAGDDAVLADVDVRGIELDGPPGSWLPWQRGVSTDTAMFLGEPGSTYCFRARAVAPPGEHGSDWSAERCTALPLPRDAMRRNGDWTRHGGAFRSRDGGATLISPAVTARGLAVNVWTCARCGMIEITWNGERLARVSTRSSGEPAQRLVALPPLPAEQRGVARVRVLSDGRPVLIESLVTGRA